MDKENQKPKVDFKSLPDIFYVNEIELDPVWGKVAHKGKQHELMHVLQGNVEVFWENKGKSFSLHEGSTFITPSDTLHRDITNNEETVKVLMIHFYWKSLPAFMELTEKLWEHTLKGETDFQVRRLFDDMRLDSGIAEADRMLANARLMNLLMLFYREAVGTPRVGRKNSEHYYSSISLIVADAKKYLEKNYRQPLRLEDVASALELSPYYLSRVFARESDFSLFQYLNEVRINEAKKMLHEGRYIISDIAHMVGFESSNYFSKVFREHVGCSPTQYR